MLIDDIKNGENDQLEFKEVPNRDSAKWLKTVVAFANGRGGRVVFGVSNDRRVVGIAGDLFAMKDAIADWPNAVRAVIYRPQSPKADIESPKADIEKLLSGLKGKLRRHTEKVLENALRVDFFKRSDVMLWTGLSHTAASDLLDNLLSRSLIVSVIGHGKGAYCFVKSTHT